MTGAGFTPLKAAVLPPAPSSMPRKFTDKFDGINLRKTERLRGQKNVPQGLKAS